MTIGANGVETQSPETIYNNNLEEAKINVVGFQDLPADLIQNLIQALVNVELNTQDMVANIFNGIAPQFANDEQFLNYGQSIGVQPKPQTRGQVTLTFSGTSGTLIPVGIKAKSDTVTVQTTQQVVIGSTGSVSVLAENTTDLLQPIQANTINTMVDTITGVTVNNLTSGTEGLDEETIEEYKKSVYEKIQTKRLGAVESIYSLLHDVSGVDQRLIKVNRKTKTVSDIVYGGIEVVVGGGSDEEVAAAIVTCFMPNLLGSKPSNNETDRTVNQTVRIFNSVFSIAFTRPKLYETSINVLISFDDVVTTNQIIEAIIKEPIENYINSVQLGEKVNKASLNDIIYTALQENDIQTRNIASLNYEVKFNGTAAEFVNDYLPLFDDTYMVLSDLTINEVTTIEGDLEVGKE